MSMAINRRSSPKGTQSDVPCLATDMVLLSFDKDTDHRFQLLSAVGSIKIWKDFSFSISA